MSDKNYNLGDGSGSEDYSIINMKTGEVMGKYDPKKPRLPSSQFMLIFGKMLIKHEVEVSSLQMAIIQEMNTNNRLSLSTASKKELAKTAGVSYGTILNNFSNMIRNGILHRESSNNYFVNPHLFTKAS